METNTKIFTIILIILTVIFLLIQKTPLEQNEVCTNKCIGLGYDNGSYAGNYNCICKNESLQNQFKYNITPFNITW